jgi:CubicO group peptidase (beta-lactamase class C family)
MKKKLLTGTIFGLAAAGAAYAVYRRRNVKRTGEAADVHGFVNPGFESVRDAFVENFALRNELGGACCVYQNGEKIVDLWGGTRDKRTGDPWDHDTMVVVYSTTKGLAAMTLAIAHSRGWLDYEELVCTYWPEFAQNGKERITVRQLLAHQAGLFAFDEPVDKHTVADLDRLAEVLARQRPAWEPGSRQAYHAISLGFYESELLRRVDPLHRSLGQFFQDEIASPLGIDFYIRLPESIPNSHLAVIEPISLFERIFGFPLKLALATLNHQSNIYRALVVNPGAAIVHDEKHDLLTEPGGSIGRWSRNSSCDCEGHTGSSPTGAAKLGLRNETLELLAAPATPPAEGFYDECMLAEARFSLGFGKQSDTMPFPNGSSFGHPGAGGSTGFADTREQYRLRIRNQSDGYPAHRRSTRPCTTGRSVQGLKIARELADGIDRAITVGKTSLPESLRV